MASGQPPWSEKKFNNQFQAMNYIGNTDAIPQIPDWLSHLAKDFTLQCLIRDPSKRAGTKELLQHNWFTK